MAGGPSLAGFVEIVRLVGRGALGGAPAPGKPARKTPRAERKAQGSVDTARLRREELAGFGILASVVCVIVGAFVAQLGLFSSGPARPIILASSSTPQLQKALFSGELAIVECLSAQRAEPSAVLLDAMAGKLLPADLAVVAVDCDAPLPSGKSLLERLDISSKGSNGVTLLSASPATYMPTVLASSSTRSAEALGRAVKTASAPRFVQLNSTLDLHRFCLRRQSCLLLLSSGRPAAAAVLRAAKAYRGLPLVAVDRRSHSASFSDLLPATTRPVLLALKPTPTSDTGASIIAYKGALDSQFLVLQDGVSKFVADVVAGSLAFKPLEAPTIRLRSKNEGSGAQELLPEEDPRKAAVTSTKEITL